MAAGLDVLTGVLSVANSYSRGEREFEKATAMLFPSEIAQRGRMRDHTAAPFRRRVTHRAALPFIALNLIVMALMIALPAIVLWLPGLMF